MHATRFSSHSTGARRYPLSYVYSGDYYWGNGTLNYQGSFGLWWSTAAYSDSRAYFLDMGSSNINPQVDSNKADGVPLRCVSLGFTFSRRYPLSYVYTEFFDFSGGYIWYQSNGGYYWTQTIYTTGQAYFLVINVGLNPQFYASYSAGMALRSIGTRRYPLSYVYSGRYNMSNGLLDLQNSYGLWWSSLASSSTQTYYFRMSGTEADPVYPDGRSFTFTLRCVSLFSRRYPLSYVFSGGYGWGGGNLVGQGFSGGWWSTTANSDSNVYRLSMNSSDLNPQGNHSKAGGNALRCVS